MKRKTSLRYRAKSTSVSMSLRGEFAIGCSHISRNRIASEELEVNAIWIQAEVGEVLFISVDVMYLGREVRAYVEDLFSNLLTPDQILIGATHTHGAPNLDSSKANLMSQSLEFVHETKVTLTKVYDSLCQQDWENVTIQASRVSFPGAVRRRRESNPLLRKLRLVKQRTLMLPEFREETELFAWRLLVSGDSGGRSMVYVSPCHPVADPDREKISADYPGHMRSFFRNKFSNPNGQEAVFCFFQGAAGDVRPLSLASGRPKSLSELVLRATHGPVFGEFTSDGYRDWLADLMISLDARTEGVLASRDVCGAISSQRVTQSMSDFIGHASATEREFSVQRVDFGEMKIVGVSAELTSKLGKFISEVSCGDEGRVLVISCIDDTLGYLSHPDEVPFGGYEVDGWFSFFYDEGTYDPMLASNRALEMLATICGSTRPPSPVREPLS